MKNTHYDTLNIAPNAVPEVVAAAYKALSRLHHPDLNGNDPAATRRMAALNAAYGILSKPKKRVFYDVQLRRPVPTVITPPPPRPAPPRPAHVTSPAVPRVANSYALSARLATFGGLAACGVLFVLYDTALHLPLSNQKATMARQFMADDIVRHIRLDNAWPQSTHPASSRDLF